MKCRYCGKEIEDGSLFCTYCGKKVETVYVCSKCGAEVDKDDKFCTKCGNTLSEEKETLEAYQVAIKAKKEAELAAAKAKTEAEEAELAAAKAKAAEEEAKAEAEADAKAYAEAVARIEEEERLAKKNTMEYFEAKQYQKAYDLIVKNGLHRHPECATILESCKRELESQYISKAEKKMSNGDKLEAMVLLDQVLKIDPDNVKAAKLKQELLSRKKITKAIWTVVFIVLLIGIGYFIYMSMSNSKSLSDDQHKQSSIENEMVENTESSDIETDSRIIAFVTDMYNESRYEDNSFLESHCTPQLLNRLKDEYYYDQPEDGVAYARWLFRTKAQEGKYAFEEDNKNVSRIINVYPQGNGWYLYEFYDSGWLGKNQVHATIKNNVVWLDDLQKVYSELDDSDKVHDEVEQISVNVNYIQIDGTNLRLRLGPSTDSAILTDEDGNNVYLDKGTRLEYLGEENDFYKVRYNGNTVYVSKQFSFKIY